MPAKQDDSRVQAKQVFRRAAFGLLIEVLPTLALLDPATRYAERLGPESVAGFWLLAGVASIPIIAAVVAGMTVRRVSHG
jgi:hypothetical protein